MAHDDSAALRAYTVEETYAHLATRPAGLTKAEALERQGRYGKNALAEGGTTLPTIIVRQVTGNPLIIVLAVATAISYALGQHVSSYYIFAMMAVSVVLGVWNEYGAERTVRELLKKISPTAIVLRDDERTEIPVAEVTVGDVVLLSRGSIAPADLRLVEAHGLACNESALTGESLPVEKTAAPAATPAQGRPANLAYMGSTVEAGFGKGVVIRIGAETEFGSIAKSTVFAKPQTDFEKGLASFGSLLVRVILVLTAGIFIVNALFGHPILDSLLFALAIAVGLTPELLPVIVTISLSHGAGILAKKHVVVKQLIAVENLGNMDILCTDKTGTLTEGSIELVSYEDAHGKKTAATLQAALLCNDALAHRKVMGTGIDAAVWHYALKNHVHLEDAVKIAGEPFDFERRMAFAVVEEGSARRLIVNGAPEAVLASCRGHDAEKLRARFDALSRDGYRVTAVAAKPVEEKAAYGWDDAAGSAFLGFLVFLDVPKLSAKQALAELARLDVAVKIITGDNEIITKKVCGEVGMEITGLLLGADIAALSDEALTEAALRANVFARTSPEDKARIIAVLRKAGHVVGYMGDGVNDIPSLRAADVGISVNTAVAAAKEAASIVLLSKGLKVVADGIREGRITFANTIKYILMGTSSNFGNMFSAAGASFFLPFLPMTPVQILLTNGLYDLSQLAIPTDRVDPESLHKPRHWDVRFIRNYMVFFGPISSVYDFLTFGVMLFVFHAQGALFQTGWFIESMMTEILVVFVIRTSRVPFWKSRPGNWLLGACLGIVFVSVLLPFSPLAASLGLVAPPLLYFFILLALVTTYLLLVEFLKRFFLVRFSL